MQNLPNSDKKSEFKYSENSSMKFIMLLFSTVDYWRCFQEYSLFDGKIHLKPIDSRPSIILHGLQHMNKWQLYFYCFRSDLIFFFFLLLFFYIFDWLIECWKCCSYVTNTFICYCHKMSLNNVYLHGCCCLLKSILQNRMTWESIIIIIITIIQRFDNYFILTTMISA